MSPETAGPDVRVSAPPPPRRVTARAAGPAEGIAAPTEESADASVGAATALLGDYRPDEENRFFSSPTRTLLAHGARAEVPHSREPLGARVAKTLEAAREDGDRAPIVVGAVPFRVEEPAALVVPQAARWAPPLRQDPLIALPAPASVSERWDVVPVPDVEVYEKSVREAIARMDGGELSKVVLARTLELRSRAAGPDVAAMLQRLARRDPGGYTFALPTAPGRTLLGASPELLVSRRGGHLVANPLAGSVARSTDLAEDVRAAAGLLESTKDLHEHAVVVADVQAALAPYCSELVVPSAPTLVRTATMWHLSTTVTGRVREDARASSLDLALALHPTPAVCGTPTALARETIAELEPFDRGFFAGMVGWTDARGDGEWVVTLRCGEADAEMLRLYAGAGVVSASVPASESAETGAKFGTFLNAVGAER